MGTEVTPAEINLQISGRRVHLRDAGSGPPLLLVHGLGGPLVWQRVLEPLSRRFRVLSVDLPGFGESDPAPAGRHGSGDHAELLYGVTEMLEIRKLILCGISWGGEVAVRFADRHLGSVERIVLLCSTGLRHRPYLAGPLAAKLVPALVKSLVRGPGFVATYFSRRAFYRIESRPADLLQRFRENLRMPGRMDAFSKAFFHALRGDAEFAERLSRLAIPSLIVWGNNDAVVPVKDGPGFQRHLPGSTLELFSECGHAIPLEKPQELVAAILRFTCNEQSTT